MSTTKPIYESFLREFNFEETQGQTEHFLILFEKIRFAHNDWRLSEQGKLPVRPRSPMLAEVQMVCLIRDWPLLFGPFHI